MVVLDFGGTRGRLQRRTRRARCTWASRPTRSGKVHEIVQRAQQAGFEAVRPGRRVPGDRPRRRKVIADAGYGERFIHRTGHGIGLTAHEPPYMVEGEEHLLGARDVLLDRARDLPSERVRGSDRGHRRRHRGRRSAAEQRRRASSRSSPEPQVRGARLRRSLVDCRASRATRIRPRAPQPERCRPPAGRRGARRRASASAESRVIAAMPAAARSRPRPSARCRTRPRAARSPRRRDRSPGRSARRGSRSQGSRRRRGP